MPIVAATLTIIGVSYTNQCRCDRSNQHDHKNHHATKKELLHHSVFAILQKPLFNDALFTADFRSFR